MGALLGNPIVSQDDNLVGVTDGREAMGNDESRFADHEAFQSLLD